MTQPAQPESPAQPKPPSAPRVLVIARWLWIASTLVGLARSFVQLSDRQRLVSELHEAAPQLSQDQLDAAASSGIAMTLMFAVATLAVYLMLTGYLVHGRNWARVVLTVFGAFGSVGTACTLLLVAGLGRETVMRLTGVTLSVSNLLLSVVVLILECTALVLMFQSASNRFFRESAVSAGGQQRPGVVPWR